MPKTDLDLKPLTIRLTPRQRDYYAAVGDGNMSEGIRREADRAMAIMQGDSLSDLLNTALGPDLFARLKLEMRANG